MSEKRQSTSTNPTSRTCMGCCETQDCIFKKLGRMLTLAGVKHFAVYGSSVCRELQNSAWREAISLHLWKFPKLNSIVHIILVPFLNIFEMPYATVLFNSHQTIKKKNLCRKDLPIYDNIVFEPTVVDNYLVLLNILLSWKGFIFFPQF